MKTKNLAGGSRFIALNFIPLMLALFSALPQVQAATGTWTNDASGNWSATANWLSAIVPGAAGDIVNLKTNITAARTVTIDTTSRTVGTLNIGDPTSIFYAYTLAASGGATLTFNNSGLTAILVQATTTATDVISAPLTLTDNLSITNSSTLTLSGIIGGAATKGITKSGAGNLNLSGVNTFPGGVNVIAGKLTLGNASALGATAGTLNLAGSTTLDSSVANLVNANNNPITINGDFTFNGTQNLNLGAGATSLGTTAGSSRTLTITNNTLTLGGIIADGTTATNLIKAGAGTLLLTNANTFSGGINLNVGKLTLGNAAALGATAGPLTIANGTTLDSSVINLIIANNNPVIINGDFTFTGTSNLNLGTGAITLGTTAGSSRTITSSANTLTLGGSLANGTTATALQKSGNGTLVLSGANTFNGPITNTAGVLSVGADNNLGLGTSLVFNGGTFQVTGTTLASFGAHTPAFIAAKTVTMDINNVANNFTVSQSLNQTTGGLTKLGAGTLTLTTANTYTGTTTISAGTLTLGASGSIAASPLISIAAGTTLDGSAVTGGFTLGATQTLASSGTNAGAVIATAGAAFLPGGSGTIGTNTFTSSLTLNGNLLTFDLTNSAVAPTNDLMAINGVLTLNGANTIKLNLLSALPVGTYTLITYASLAGSGTFSLSDDTSGRATLTVGATSVTLTVATTALGSNLAWWGDGVNNTWEIGNTTFWTNGISALVSYYNYDRVTINDTGDNTIPINLTTTVLPYSITVNNTAKNFTIQGVGKISGVTGLTKTGTGSLTLANAGLNDYSGPTTISAGTLILSGNNSLTTNATTVAAGATLRVGAANNLPAGTLTLNGTVTPAVLDLRNDASTSFNKDVIFANQTNTINVDMSVSGTGGTHLLGTLSQPSAAVRTLTVTGANGYGLTIGNFGLCPASGNNTTLVANTNVTLLDVTNPENGYNAGNFDTLTLSGTAAGCLISGVIEDATGLNVTNNQPASLANGGTTRVTKTGTGTWTLSGANIYSGITTVSAGTLALTGSGTLGSNSTAALTVSGGILDLGGTSQSVSNVTLSGGTIQNGILTGTSYACSTGTVSAVLAGAGVALTKTTASPVTLLGANTYSGPTTISAGTLTLGATGSIANSPLITIAAGATNDVSLVTGGFQLGASQTLACSGTVTGAVNAASGAIFLPGGSGTIGTNIFNSPLTLNGNTLTFDLTNSVVPSTNDTIVLNGTGAAGVLTINGANTIKLNLPLGTLQAGTYSLMTYASLAGGGTLSLAANYRNASLTVGATSVILTVTGSGIGGVNLTWVGDGIGNPWDIGTSSLWTNGTSMDLYYDFDKVTVDDTGSASPSLNLTTALNPISLTVTNVTKNYTLAGAGSLAGSASLTKSGTGSLTLSTANTHTGATTLNDGLLTVSGVGTLGGATGALNVNGGILDLAGTSQVKGAINITNCTIQNGTLTGTAFAAQGGTVSATLAGVSATLTKTSTNTLILSSNNTYGPTVVSAGMLQIGNNGTSGSLGSGNVTGVSSAILAFSRTDAIAVNNTIGSGGASPNIQINSGTVTLGGSFDNSGAGATIYGGTLILAKNTVTNVWALGGGVNIVYTNGTLKLGGTSGDQIWSGAALTLAGGTLDLAGLSESLTTLSGYGILTNSGGGTPTFTATGNLTVTNGTLAVIGGSLQAGGTATIGSGATLSQSGGAAFATGGMTVNSGGVLTGTGTNNSTVTVASGGRLVPGYTGLGTNNISALTLSSGSTVDFEIKDATTLDKVIVTTSGGLALNNVAINLYNPGTTTPFTTNGTYTLFQYSGSLGGTGIGALALANAQGGKTYTFGTSGTTVQVTIGDVPPNYWNVDADGSWATGGNWTALAAPNGVSSAANFGGGGTVITAPRTVTLDGNYTNGAISFSNSVNSFTIVSGTGGALALDNSSAAATITDLAGNHTLAVSVALPAAGVNVSVAPASALSLNGAVSGAAAIAKSGAGTLTLGGVNTYTGPTTVSAGTLTLSGDNSSATGAKIVNAGTLAVSGGGILGAPTAPLNVNGGGVDLGTTAQSAGTVTIAGGTIANGTLTGTTLAGQSGAVSATLAGSVPLIKTTTNTLTLSGANAYTGGTAISGGQLNVSGSGTLGNPAGALGVTNSTLDLGGTSQTVGAVTINNSTIQNGTLAGSPVEGQSGTISAVLAGAGGLTKTTAGILTLAGGNTYTGGTTNTAGVLILSNLTGNALSGTYEFNGAGTSTLRLGAANQIADTTVITYNLTTAGNSRVELQGFNETIGGISDTVTNGTHIVQAASDSLNNLPATLTLAVSAGPFTYVGYVRNPAGTATNSPLSITKNGVGTQTFSAPAANVTYSGPTIINDGILEFSGASSIANLSPITVNGGAVKFSGGGTRTNSITGAGSLIVSNGTFILAADSAHTGGTLISAGTLQLGTNSSIGSVIGGITNNGTLTVNHSNNITISGDISGTGALIKNGATNTTLILSGNNSFAGNVTVNDGSLIVKNSNALGSGTKTVALTAGTAGNCSLHLDGSGGDITLSSGISYNTSYVNGTIWSDAGNNALNGNINLTSGGGDTYIIVTSGTLTLGGGIAPTTTGRNLLLGGAGNGVVAGTITNGTGANILLSVRKLDSGTWTLAGNNTYTGNTSVEKGALLVNSGTGSGAVTVTNSTLGGTGTISGAVTVNSSGILAPGTNAIGTLNLGSTLTLAAGSTNLMEINRTNTPNADKLNLTTGTLAYAGTLKVVNLGDPLVGGEVFDLYDAPAFNTGSSFSTLDLPALGAGLNWWTANLVTNGTIVVNRAPLAGAISMGAQSGTPTSLQIIGGKFAPTDADGDTLLVSAVQSLSNQGGTVATDGTSITYTSALNFTGTDTFTYIVSDGRGGLATNIITANVPVNNASFNLLSGPVDNGNGTATITYTGIPNYQYALETTPSLALPITWTPLITNTAASNGQLSFTFSTAASQGFFRTRYVP